MIKTLIVIPARYGSTRLPGKPLYDLGGMTMIERVWRQAKKVKHATEVIVATDHEEILKTIVNLGGKAMLTSPNHKSGTDRVAEVAERYNDYDYFVNVQGDEPGIDPRQVESLIENLVANQDDIATQCRKIRKAEDVFDFDKVKVVFDSQNIAMYFSRQAIPAIKKLSFTDWFAESDYFEHVGLYGFKAGVLANVSDLRPSKLEVAESLEQLRWMEAGYRVKVYETVFEGISVDTEADAQSFIGQL